MDGIQQFTEEECARVSTRRDLQEQPRVHLLKDWFAQLVLVMCLLPIERLTLELVVLHAEAVLGVVDVPPEEVVIPPEEAPVMMVPPLGQAVEPVGRSAGPGDSEEEEGEREECGDHPPAFNWQPTLS